LENGVGPEAAPGSSVLRHVRDGFVSYPGWCTVSACTVRQIENRSDASAQKRG
jgi:hypothetical protein